MALNKVNYVDGETVITAENMNDIQDAIIALENAPTGGAVSDDLKQAILQLAQKVAYIDDQGQTYYDDLYNALYPPKTVVSITAVFEQGTTVIYDDTALNDLKQYLTVTARYDDNTTAVLPDASYTLSGTLEAGTSSVTVNYNGIATSFDVVVTARPTLSSITAVYTQSGTVYDTDTLDSLKADLVVTAVYSDSSTQTVPAADYTLTGTLTAGTSTITVTYGGKTTTFNVIVTAVSPLWIFSNGYTCGKGTSSSSTNYRKIYRQTTAARACGAGPIENKGYVFTVTDSTKYNLAAYDVTDNTPQSTSYAAAIDGVWYQGGAKSVSWKASDSVTSAYVWLALKKMDGTSFTDEELANGAEAVFTYTEAE